MLCWSSREEIPHAQGKRNPSKMVGVARGHQRADTLKPYSQKTSHSNHTKTTALSNSMKLSHVRLFAPWTVAHQAPLSTREHQRADTLKPYSQKTSQSNHSRATALSNSVKPSHACRATQDGWVMVERSDRMWSTGEGNASHFSILVLRTP